MSHSPCDDFTRSAFLRDAIARAGDGLPAVDSRMPTPAGTGLSRRSFLLRAGATALTVYGASRLGVGALDEGVAEAAGQPGGPVLVSVFLEGGADALSILAPTGDPLYRRLRPRLGLSDHETVAFAEDSRLRWHPAAAALATLHSEGKLTVIPAVGYDDPDQSHFTSRHYWEVGAVDPKGNTGWLGRYLDLHGSPSNPLQGLSFTSQLSPTLAAARVPVAALDDLDDFAFQAAGVGAEMQGWMVDALAELGKAEASADPALARAGTALSQAAMLSRQLGRFDVNAHVAQEPRYPSDEERTVGDRLRTVAAMIGAGLPLRCVAISGAGDYDTHDNQQHDFDRNLRVTADSLLAFQRDLERRGVADRVVVHVWSEFGRRAEENASAGTDHGAGGFSCLIGSRVKGTMVGEFPGLDRLDGDGNLRATADFRGVYAALLEQWLGVDAVGILPGAERFHRPVLIG
jgi:uncharacterized protein (DUF1501 family)